jgi:hypothetical protein
MSKAPPPTSPLHLPVSRPFPDSSEDPDADLSVVDRDDAPAAVPELNRSSSTPMLKVPPPPPHFLMVSSLTMYDLSRRTMAHTIKTTSALFESSAHSSGAKGERCALLIQEDGLFAIRGEGSRAVVKMIDDIPVVKHAQFHLSGWGRWRDDDTSHDARVVLSFEEMKQHQETFDDAAPVHTWHVPFGLESRCRVYPDPDRNGYFEPLPIDGITDSPFMLSPTLFSRQNSVNSEPPDLNASPDAIPAEPREPSRQPKHSMLICLYLWHPSLGFDVMLRSSLPSASVFLNRLHGEYDFSNSVGAELRAQRAAETAATENNFLDAKTMKNVRQLIRANLKASAPIVNNPINPAQFSV